MWRPGNFPSAGMDVTNAHNVLEPHPPSARTYVAADTVVLQYEFKVAALMHTRIHVRQNSDITSGMFAPELTLVRL